MSAKYKSPSFLLPNELNTSANPANDTGINSLYSMDFDSASSDYIDAGSSIGVIGTGVRTFSVWLKTSNTTITQTVLGTRNANTDGWVIQISLNSILFYNVKGGGRIWSTVVNLTDGDWHHLVIVRAGTANNRIYVDGVSQTLNTQYTQENLTDPQSSKNLLIGAGYTTGGALYRFFDGKMDEVAIFNRALNTTEIAALYDGTGSNIRPSNLMATDLNPIAYYPLGEQAQMQGYLGNEASSEWQFPNGVLQDYVMDFDGSNRINCGTSSLGITNAITVSAWVKIPSTTPNSVQPIVCERDNTIGNNWSLRYRGGSYNKYYFIAWNTNGNTVSAPSAGITPNVDEWQHVVGVYDGSSTGRSYVYVNGVWRGTSQPPTGSGINSTSSVAPSIGGFQDLSAFVGSISNVQVFNTVLPLTGTNSIQTLYNNGSPLVDMSGFTSLTNWWKLNADSVYTPSAPNYTTALDFDAASSDYIDAGSSIGAIGTGVRTFSVWLKTSSNAIQTILGTRNVNTDGWVIQWNQPGILFFNPLGGTNKGILSTTGNAAQQYLIDGNWHHIVIVRAGTGNNKIYVDGVSQTLNTAFGDENLTDPQSSKNLLIGAGYTTGGALFRYFDGELSNTAIFNSALTESQVSTLFNFGTPETNISFSPQAWWKLDDQNAITDYSGNGNTGTNNGATNAPGGVAVVPSWKIPDASGTSNGVSTTLPSTALQQSDLQFDSPYSNYSLSFDGITSVSMDFTNTSTKGSISVWVKPIDYTTGQQVIWCYNGSGNKDYIGLFQLTSGVLGFETADNGTNKWRVATTSAAVSNNTWTHLLCTFDGSNAVIYVNGVAVPQSYTITSDTTYWWDDLIPTNQRLGILNVPGYGTGQLYNGSMDENTVWNTNLTEAQVLEIYNNGRPKDLSTFSGTAPISWWRLGENAYFQDTTLVLPNSITGAPNGEAATNNVEMISADAPGTYANGIGTNLAILDRVGDAPLSTSNSQSYNMIPSDISPYVPQYVGNQISNTYSMSFNGTDEYFNVGNITELNNLSAFSTSSWFKTSNVSNAPIILNGGSSSTNRFYLQLLNSTTIRYVIGSSVENITVSNIADGNWHYISTVQNGTSLDIYLDGAKQNTSTITVVSPSTNIGDNFKIGRYFLSAANYFNGQIDEVAIFDKALTADQIKFDLYQPSFPAGDNKTADIANNPNLPNPVAWYRMGD